jgi:phospholipid N-methyltransferase
MSKTKIVTAFEFAKNLFTTGALFETTKKTEVEIVSKLSKQPKKVFVEYGIGHGNITKKMLDTIHATSKLYAFEVNQEFCDYVAEHIKDDRLEIINDGAENLTKYVKEDVSGFVSSIPFTFFSKEKRAQILNDTYEKLEKDGTFSQVLYSKFHFKLFDKIFDRAELKKVSRIPLEYIYHCQKG